MKLCLPYWLQFCKDVQLFIFNLFKIFFMLNIEGVELKTPFTGSFIVVAGDFFASLNYAKLKKTFCLCLSNFDVYVFLIHKSVLGVSPLCNGNLVSR